MMMNLPNSLFKTVNCVFQLISIEVALIIISVKVCVCVCCQLTCFAPADGWGLPAFGRALDGDLLVQLQALSRGRGGCELQLL